MKKYMSLILAIGLLSACSKSDSNTGNVPVNTDPCNSVLPNKVSCRFNGAQWCADSICFADYAIGMTIFGQTFDGASLLIELDDIQPGTYPITLDRNHVLYISAFGMAYESSNSQPGQITITSNDPVTNHLKGTFQLNVLDPLLSSWLPITNGNIDVYYTE